MLKLIVDEVDERRVFNRVRTDDNGEAFAPITLTDSIKQCSPTHAYYMIKKGIESDEQYLNSFLSEDESATVYESDEQYLNSFLSEDANYSCDSSSSDEEEDFSDEEEEECPPFLMDSSYIGKRRRMSDYADYDLDDYPEDNFEDNSCKKRKKY